MQNDRVFCVIDYETYSTCDLKKSGAFEYSKHPSTEILCAAFRMARRSEMRSAKTKLWVPSGKESDFGILLKALRSPDVDLVAHNSLFEQVITQNVLGPRYMKSKASELYNIPVERWHCTAAMARSIGLPGDLAGAGEALNLSAQKDKEGHRLMLKLCKPAKDGRRNNDPAMLESLARYCIQDVNTEVELFLALPPLHPKERRFWVLNQKMNLRGFAVDRKLVTNAQKLITFESRRLDARVQKLTGGKIKSARQRNAVLDFLRQNGLDMPDLRAETVRETLAKHRGEKSRAVALLTARDAISRSSTAKYAAFELRSRFDGRARDNTVFFGAHTGRENGTGLQPLNLFKSVFKTQDDVDAGIELIKAGDRHAIEAIFPKPLDLYASALRSCIIAPPGSVLEVGDFSTIEVRVLFWLADETAGLEQIRRGVDLYCEMAGKIFNEDAKEIQRLYLLGDKSAQMKRQLGKQTVLGAGFGIGLGGEKFQKTAIQYGMDISLDLARASVRAYREQYPSVPAFWTNIERAAIAAIRNPEKKYRTGRLVWQKEGRRLTCLLPSGRLLSYFDARVSLEKTLYGPRPRMEYSGVISPSKIFGRVHTWGGKLAENVVQAVARDCLYEALERLDASGKRTPVLAVHDEIVCERDVVSTPQSDFGGEGALTEFLNTMGEVPAWAEGLPLKVEGWSEKRYRK